MAIEPVFETVKTDSRIYLGAVQTVVEARLLPPGGDDHRQSSYDRKRRKIGTERGVRGRSKIRWQDKIQSSVRGRRGQMSRNRIRIRFFG